MRILVGITSYSEAKNYTHKKLVENMETCVQPVADVMTFGDKTIPGIEHFPMPSIPSTWADDYLYEARDRIRSYAAEGDYDAFIWQGSDCYYNSYADFKLFTERAMVSNYDAVGALTAGRNRPDYPVARRFTDGGPAQHEIPEEILLSGTIVDAGFPGADALLVKKNLFNETWKNWYYTPWYEHPAELCVEEFWCMIVTRMGHRIGLDTFIRTWHVHENGMASRWPMEYEHQDDLVFEGRG